MPRQARETTLLDLYIFVYFQHIYINTMLVPPIAAGEPDFPKFVMEQVMVPTVGKEYAPELFPVLNLLMPVVPAALELGVRQAFGKPVDMSNPAVRNNVSIWGVFKMPMVAAYFFILALNGLMSLNGHLAKEHPGNPLDVIYKHMLLCGPMHLLLALTVGKAAQYFASRTSETYEGYVRVATREEPDVHQLGGIQGLEIRNLNSSSASGLLSPTVTRVDSVDDNLAAVHHNDGNPPSLAAAM